MKKLLKRLLIVVLFVLFVPYAALAYVVMFVVTTFDFLVTGNDKFSDNLADFLFIEQLSKNVIKWCNK